MRMFISGYNRIPNHLNTLRVDAKIFVSAKKYLRKKNFRIRVDMAFVLHKKTVSMEYTGRPQPSFFLSQRFSIDMSHHSFRNYVNKNLYFLFFSQEDKK